MNKRINDALYKAAVVMIDCCFYVAGLFVIAIVSLMVYTILDGFILRR